MSRAFVRENDATAGVVPLPDRPVSPHRNLVTRRGLRLIETRIAEFQNELADAAVAAEAREQRYWTARRASAEVSEPEAGADAVVFGAAVTVRRDDGTVLTFRIVGEDEADPAAGRIAWTAPVARALLGAEPGETRELPTGEIEILAIEAAPEPFGVADPA
ncbi:MAG: GreA/GreB family elongation factor [Geminicoccaceae bacterium]|jgi:transcription elongation GreA/GreB family factor|nr:GreA/GreB family elongation factor [Geminicoccaceae bacterium]